jgi:hypothetical protein
MTIAEDSALITKALAQLLHATYVDDPITEAQADEWRGLAAAANRARNRLVESAKRAENAERKPCKACAQGLTCGSMDCPRYGVQP